MAEGTIGKQDVIQWSLLQRSRVQIYRFVEMVFHEFLVGLPFELIRLRDLHTSQAAHMVNYCKFCQINILLHR